MNPVVLADLSIDPITGSSKVHGNLLDVEMQILVRNNGDDDAKGIVLIVTFPPTTHRVSSTPAGQPISAHPPENDPNLPPNVGVIAGTEIRIPDLGTPAGGKSTFAARVAFTMVGAAKTIGGGVSVGAFVRGTRPDSDGGNNAAHFKVP
jgi:hypothetical protein